MMKAQRDNSALCIQLRAVCSNPVFQLPLAAAIDFLLPWRESLPPSWSTRSASGAAARLTNVLSEV